jgi:hypothetical protein
MKRKKFLAQTASGAITLLINPLQLFAAPRAVIEPYKLETVKEFVIAGHGNFSHTKELLQQYPNLLYCRYDWGNGDFEEALEGAGHVGNKEIANYLIEKGARPNIFVLSMLGQTSIVKSVLGKYPTLLHSLGPHGLTLLHHAQIGGEDAKDLVAYLKEKGLSQTQIKIK